MRNPKHLLFLATIVLLVSCTATERVKIRTSKPRPLSGTFLVTEKNGHTATLKGFPYKIDIPAEKDTVKKGDWIPVVVVNPAK